MPVITITHQEDKTEHSFRVKDAYALTQTEVNRICQGMYVEAIFVNGRLYRSGKALDRDKYIQKLIRSLK